MARLDPDELRLKRVARTRPQEYQQRGHPARDHSGPHLAIGDLFGVCGRIARERPKQRREPVVNLLIRQAVVALEFLLGLREAFALNKALAAEKLAVPSSSYAAKLVPRPDVSPTP
jgi:hypothetical protein